MSDFAGSLMGGTVTEATAGGMAVLGGLLAAPALAALGLFMGASASKNLDNAKSNRAKARQFSEEMESVQRNPQKVLHV